MKILNSDGLMTEPWGSPRGVGSGCEIKNSALVHFSKVSSFFELILPDYYGIIND